MYLFDFILFLFSAFILVVGVLVAVAFLTLFERKILGYIQVRKGPNKVGFLGLIQPFGDALKLFSKENMDPLMSNFISYYFSPIFSLFLSLFMWFCIPFFTGFVNFNFSILFFLCCSSLGVYTIMIAGWSSNSNYSFLGSLRSVAQSISYEVSFALIFISFFILISSLSIMDLFMFQYYVWFLFLCLPMSLIWFVSGLAETNRTPFDFAEGESELVSGFNVEYSGGGFAMIFLAEYSSILIMSLIFAFMFLGGMIYSWVFFIFVFSLVFVFLWVRGTLPRFRYDKLMYLAWKSFLPVSLNFMFFLGGMKCLLYTLFL
uniref:NADH-ubiquinone oxidoreductase chain 1 n=1 Tax=Elateroidea sp. 10 KM-2017 TaxID=2219424 RepID=A0A346RH02_9COLE|nr:NADH dehydrogenase subunit 1 [Elateroidea sp. 10 KM-2017]